MTVPRGWLPVLVAVLFLSIFLIADLCHTHHDCSCHDDCPACVWHVVAAAIASLFCALLVGSFLGRWYPMPPPSTDRHLFTRASFGPRSPPDNSPAF